MTDIVEQGGGEKDADIFLFQREGWIGIEEADEKLLRQVIDTKRMFKPRVSGPRIDEMDKTELRDVAKSLKVLGVYEGEQRVGEMNISPHRVADRLAFLFEKRVVHGAQSTPGARPCQGTARVVDSHANGSYFNALTPVRPLPL